MKNDKTAGYSKVEQNALEFSHLKVEYSPEEKIRTIFVNNFPDLGKLSAMRFIEWVQNNPDGVIALPTGKTPEYFIKWVKYFLDSWKSPETVKHLESGGVDPGKYPEMKNLRFVQIDEFYPVDPSQHNSFYHYVNHFYIDGFGLNQDNALLINCTDIGLKAGETLKSIWPNGEVDLNLRFRHGKDETERMQKSALERIDQWCQDYEERIRSMGGIGFFLGGIGPDGHIGFNVRGSDHFSTTRLTETNYETQASAATDLGGIEISRKRLVITIGLGTICYNPECTAIIIAAGEAKADIVASAIQSQPNALVPATALHTLSNAAFYLTRGAASKLKKHQLELLKVKKVIDKKTLDEIIVDIALREQKRILDLKPGDIKNDPRAQIALKGKFNKIPELLQEVTSRLIEKIEKGGKTLTDKRFLHTEPHHDDLLLGYLPYIVRHVRHASNTHYFMTLTSGFTAVTNFFMLGKLEVLKEFINSEKCRKLVEEDYFKKNNDETRKRDVWQFLDGIAANSQNLKNEGDSRRLLRNLTIVYDTIDINVIQMKIAELLHYFASGYPGQKDREDVQRLKGMCREWEAECLWGYFGWDSSFILHLRLGFYKGDIFTEIPTVERDVAPIVKTMEKANPDIISVALDPEASGPDTHYKVLQAITEALKRYEEKTGRTDIRIWGYRNVWYRFHPSDADIAVPVSLNMFSIMQSAFKDTFVSQRDASFPSYEHDGPFSELAQKIQVEQYQKLKICLGRSWFYEHSSPLIRATRGIVFLKELSLEGLYHHSRALRQATEKKI